MKLIISSYIYDNLQIIKQQTYINIDYSKTADKSLAVLLEISTHSLEWWKKFKEKSNNAQLKIAPWIALDLAGALVGMATAIIISGARNPTRAVNREDVLIDALVTGVTASTGVVGRLGGFLRGKWW